MKLEGLDRQQIAIYAGNFDLIVEAHSAAGHPRMARFYKALRTYLAEEMKQLAGHPVREDADRWESLTVVASALSDDEVINVLLSQLGATFTLPNHLLGGVPEVDNLFQPVRDEMTRRGLSDEVFTLWMAATE